MHQISKNVKNVKAWSRRLQAATIWLAQSADMNGAGCVVLIILLLILVLWIHLDAQGYKTGLVMIGENVKSYFFVLDYSSSYYWESLLLFQLGWLPVGLYLLEIYFGTASTPIASYRRLELFYCQLYLGWSQTQ
jgi:hypothetical protein